MRKLILIGLATASTAFAQEAPKTQIGLDFGYNLFLDSEMKDADMDQGFGIGFQSKFFLDGKNALIAAFDYNLNSGKTLGANTDLGSWFVGAGYSLRQPIAPTTSVVAEALVGAVGGNTTTEYPEIFGGTKETTLEPGLGYRAALAIEQQIGVVALQGRAAYTGGEATPEDSDEAADLSRLTFGVGIVLGFQ